jgi:hypothetical protein
MIIGNVGLLEIHKSEYKEKNAGNSDANEQLEKCCSPIQLARILSVFFAQM